MSDRDEPVFGMRPDGTPFAVRAQVLQGPARGALRGLAAGDALARRASGGPNVTEAAATVAESLMARGMYRPDELPPGPWVSHAAPLALFYADDDARRIDEVLRATDALDDALAAATLSGVLAKAAWQRGASRTDLLVAAIASLDAASLRLVERDESSRDAVDAANDALRAEIGLAVEPSLALEGATAIRVGLWHVAHASTPDRAVADALAAGLGAADVAAVGALAGAVAGEEAISRELREAADPAVERLCALVESGPFARG